MGKHATIVLAASALAYGLYVGLVGMLLVNVLAGVAA